MISIDGKLELWAILLLAAALGLWVEKNRNGEKPWAPFTTISIACLLSNLGVIPAADPAYDLVGSYLMPLAVPLLLFKADLARLLPQMRNTAIAFACGALGVAIGGVLVYSLLPLESSDWKLVAIFCAQYIGGPFNAAAAATELEGGDLLTPTIAVNHLVATIYILLIFALPAIGGLMRLFSISTQGRSSFSKGGFSQFFRRSSPSSHSLALALTFSSILSTIGYYLASWLGFPGSSILWVAVLAVTLVKLFPTWTDRMAGAEEIAILCLQLFFATLGAQANISAALASEPRFSIFAALIVIVHLIVIFLAAKIFRWHLSQTTVASSANITDPVTAMAIAVSRGWYNLMIPAILWGTLGSAVATFLAVQLGDLLLR